MPDMEKLGQIQMLTNLMSTMPPQLDQQGRPLPGRVPFPRGKAAQWATELVTQYGVRVHPELAVEQTLPAGAGSTARRIDDVALTAGDLLGLLRNVPNVPSLTVLADRLEGALGDPLKEAAEMVAIRREYPDLMKTAQVLQAQAEKKLAQTGGSQ